MLMEAEFRITRGGEFQRIGESALNTVPHGTESGFAGGKEGIGTN